MAFSSKYILNMSKTLLLTFSLIIIIAGVVLFAYRDTWGKTDIEFRIHINEQLVRESVFGESPSFAIWLEDPATGIEQTVFVTGRAGAGDWEGKAEVPVALPLWFEVYKTENETKDLPNYEKAASLTVTGATPKPGYFTTRVRVNSGSEWICWIEVNLSGDYNDYYPSFNQITMTEDEFGSGQPALIYKAKIKADEGIEIIPEIAGMCVLNTSDGNIIQPQKGITSATSIFDEISIVVVKPKPKIMDAR